MKVKYKNKFIVYSFAIFLTIFIAFGIYDKIWGDSSITLLGTVLSLLHIITLIFILIKNKYVLYLIQLTMLNFIFGCFVGFYTLFNEKQPLVIWLPLIAIFILIVFLLFKMKSFASFKAVNELESAP